MYANFFLSAGILVSGTEALQFLQGQLTCDVKQSSETHPIRGAICSNKGRIMASFYLWKKAQDFLLVLPQDMVVIIMPILKKYSQFSQVSLQTIELPQSYHLPSLVEFIRSGFALISPNNSGEFTPHELAYPALNVVSLSKGCYTGQEIIARMQYRGSVKQHLYHLAYDQTATVPGTIINQVLYDNHYEALVLIEDKFIAAPNINKEPFSILNKIGSNP